MSGTWKILEKSQTSQTQYVIAEYDETLSTTQASPTTSPTTGATSPFNVEGYGQGVTIAYQVAIGTNIKLVLDINNDSGSPPSDDLWISTAATHTSNVGTFFVASKDSFKAVRLRLESGSPGPPAPSVTNIRLMANS